MVGSYVVKALAVSFTAASLAGHAAAVPATAAPRQGNITILSPAQVASFRPYAYYASAAFCQPATTRAWDCGSNCEANPSFVPIASGGDGGVTQFWFVGYDPVLQEIIVSHQGTDPSKIIPVLEDISIVQIPLNSKLFPGVKPGVLAHSGFAGSQQRSASSVLAAVKKGLSKFGAKKITVTGGSMGAAIGLVDALFLHLQFPGTPVRFVGYGMPRVGNQAFADFVDAQSMSVTHINNKEDPVPTVPGRSLGYHHPSGEVHIQDSGEWVACPGQDNTSKLCTVGDVPNFFAGNQSDHSGPYDGIMIEC